ncbi:protein translocase subunit secG [Nonlabens sp. Hel1_33_55]|uniref:preprotein translocase subunit SecG n=1 Tax=Nonlabens sp. Hel1_33_55 TaxID=1336802 RepID=UPI000875EDD8|nr:preprotein translocase subunit SecG [Nonlabens sp. Hel1_33_55]SCY25008.1 protein translocase subunit secG [Nonlabens sp. Hel1_33_55]
MTSFYIFLGLIIFVAFLLVIVIMVQNPKGGGLSSSFGGGGTQQLGGVKKTGDFLDKSTWVLSTLLLVFILAASTFLIKENQAGTIQVAEPIEVEAPDLNSTPQQTPAATADDTPETEQ